MAQHGQKPIIAAEGQTATIWAVSAVGKEGAAGWERQDCIGEGRCHPELLPLRPAQLQACTALPLPWELGRGWGGLTGLGNFPGRQSPGAGEHGFCKSMPLPLATATLQPLQPAGIGKGIIYSLTAQQGSFACLCLILFEDDGAFKKKSNQTNNKLVHLKRKPGTEVSGCCPGGA